MVALEDVHLWLALGTIEVGLEFSGASDSQGLAHVGLGRLGKIYGAVVIVRDDVVTMLEEEIRSRV